MENECLSVRDFMRQKPRRSSKLISKIDSTVFTGVLVVVLLILLLFSWMPSTHHAVSVDIPQVLHPVSMRGALRDDAIKISILRDGHVYFGRDRVWSGNLTEKIQDRLKDREIEHKVYISADMRARWSDVETVLGDVRSAGIVQVAFLTDEGRLPKLSK
jgi:biopolymer transport protein ExbD